MAGHSRSKNGVASLAHSRSKNGVASLAYVSRPSRLGKHRASLVGMPGTRPRLSGWILLDRAHGMDSSAFRAFGRVRDTEGDHAMLHQNSVFHGLLKLVPWHKLERSVEKHGADERSRKLTTKRHLTALLYGQFSGAIGLREIVGGMASHETRLYHLGAAPVKRSTMSDANRDRSWQIFSELFNEMLGQVHRGLRRAAGEAVLLIASWR